MVRNGRPPESARAAVPLRSRLRETREGVVRSAALVALAVVLAGCNGGTVDRHALTNDASTLDSIACEGALLAHDVSKGASTTYFARVHSDALRAQASHLADALSERPASPGLEPRVRAA